VCTAFVPIVSIAVVLHIPVMMMTKRKQVIYCLFLVFTMTGMCSITAILTVDTIDMLLFFCLHHDWYVQHDSSDDNSKSNNCDIKTEKELCKIADRSLVSRCRSSWIWTCPLISDNSNINSNDSTMKKENKVCKIADRSLVSGCRSSWTWACPLTSDNSNINSNNSRIKKKYEVCKLADRSLVSECRSGG